MNEKFGFRSQSGVIVLGNYTSSQPLTIGCMDENSDNYIGNPSVVGGQTADDSCVKRIVSPKQACEALFEDFKSAILDNGFDDEYVMQVFHNRMLKALRIWWLTTEQTPLATPTGSEAPAWHFPWELMELWNEWKDYVEEKDFDIVGRYVSDSFVWDDGHPSRIGCSWALPRTELIAFENEEGLQVQGGVMDVLNTSEKLREFSDWYRDVLANSDDGIWMFDYVPSPSQLEQWQAGIGPTLGTSGTSALWQGWRPSESVGYGVNRCERAKPLGSEVCGCTDPSATNFDPNATTDIVAELSTNPNATMCEYAPSGSTSGGGVVTNVLTTGKNPKGQMKRKRKGYRGFGQAGRETREDYNFMMSEFASMSFYEAGRQAAQAAFEAGGVNAMLAFLAGYNAGQ